MINKTYEERCWDKNKTIERQGRKNLTYRLHIDKDVKK